MVSCFKHSAVLALLAFTISCGKDGVAPSLFSSSCNNSCRVFVDPGPYTGNLGGIAGADAKCNASSQKPGSGTYKALIVDGTSRRACGSPNCSTGPSEHVDWVLRPNTEYRRSSDNAVIAIADTNGLLPFNLVNTISASSGQAYFSGLSADWRSDALSNCGSWTSASGGNVGSTGLGDQVDSTAIAANDLSCAGNAQGLVCVEQ
jgi:hypothetical protein